MTLATTPAEQYRTLLDYLDFTPGDGARSARDWHRQMTDLLRTAPNHMDLRDTALSQLEHEYGARFVAKFDAASVGCWPWTGALDGEGYPAFNLRGFRSPAHRLVYLRCVGPMPTNRVTHHACDARGCVNPTHLVAVTKRVNILLGRSPFADHAAATTCPAGHRLDGANILLTRTGRTCRTCNIEQSRAWRLDHATPAPE